MMMMMMMMRLSESVLIDRTIDVYDFVQTKRLVVLDLTMMLLWVDYYFVSFLLLDAQAFEIFCLKAF